MQAIKAQAVDYLMKPISGAELAAAIGRVKRITKPQLSRLAEVIDSNQTVFEKPSSVVSRLESGLLSTPIANIVFFKSLDKLVYATTVDGSEIVVDVLLKELAVRFPKELVRVHRNCVVNIGQLQRLMKNDQGKYVVTLRDHSAQLEVSRRQLSTVKRCFKSGVA